MRLISGRLMMGAFLACSIGWVIPAESAILTVAPQGDGFQTIQQALDAATSGDTVQLVDGTYAGAGNADLNFGGKTITLRSVNGPTNCTVDCGGTRLVDSPSGTIKGITVVNSEHVITIYADDFTLEDCVFKGSGQYNRPLLEIYHCHPTIANCTFRDLSGDDGGVMACEGASPTIRGCTFENNSASLDGGAIHNRFGSSPVITECRFVNNSCQDDGGAIANYDDSHPIIVACTFERNRSNDNGGAIFSRSGSNPRIFSCVFAGNRARSHGGAVYNRENATDIANCVFTGNSAHNNGGVLFCLETDRQPTLLNCTLVGNSAGLQGGAIYCEDSRGLSLLNCILWANEDETGDSEASQIFGVIPSVRYSCIQNWSGQWGDPNNHGLNPQFVDADGPDSTAGTADDNLRLSANSPCIDTGFDAPASDPFLTDCDGYPRFMGKAMDMGAYEYALPDELAAMTPEHPRLDEDVIVINETRPWSPEGPGDWLELHNVTDRKVHIGGWRLSDVVQRGLYQFTSGTFIEAQGYLVLYQDKNLGNSADPGCLSPFAIDRSGVGEILYLRSGYGGLLTGLRQQQDLEAFRKVDASDTLGRHTNSDGTVDYARLSVPTPGTANASPWVGSIVISEIMYHRAPGGRPSWGYVEVCNSGDAAVAVAGRTYTGSNTYFEWMSTNVPAKSHILISNDPSALQSTYGSVLPPGAQILKGDLDLAMIGYGNPLVLIAPFVTFDKVGYRHDWVGGDPWPLHSADASRAVTRIDTTHYGNDPNNWELAAPSPGI